MDAAQIISELSRYGEFTPTRFDKVLQVQQGEHQAPSIDLHLELLFLYL